MEQAAISFDAISSGSTVRLVVIRNVQYLCVRDVIMHVCDVTSKGACQKWDRLSDDKKNELVGTLDTFHFFGRGQSEQPVITFQGALKLVMFLSGTKASLYRATMVNILQRYYAGDGSLLEEVDANAISSEPMQQMARASLNPEMNTLSADNARVQKRRLDMEDATLTHEMEMAERQIALDERRHKMQIESQKMQIESQKMQTEVFQTHKLIMDSYGNLCSNGVMDDRAKLLFKDYLLNYMNSSTSSDVVPSGGTLAIADNSNKPITISTLTTEMGHRFNNAQLQKIGTMVSKAYKEKYGVAPSKHDQFCGQAMRPVCSYTERDRSLVEAEITSFVNNN